MAVGAYALTTLAKVKTHLELSEATWDTMLIDFINAASAFIDGYCRRNFITRTLTEYYDGTGHDTLLVKNRPITSITSLHDDVDRDFGGSTLIESDDYTFYPDEGIIKLLGESRFRFRTQGAFSKGARNVKVIYVAGYALDSIPYDLEIDACIALVKMKYNLRNKEKIASETIGAYSVSYSEEDLPIDVKNVLELYKSMDV